MKRVEGGVARVEGDVGRVEGGMDRVERGMDRVEGGVNRVEEGVGRVDGRMDQIKGGIRRVEEGVGRVEEGIQKIDKDMQAVARGIHQSLLRLKNLQASNYRYYPHLVEVKEIRAEGKRSLKGQTSRCVREGDDVALSVLVRHEQSAMWSWWERLSASQDAWLGEENFACTAGMTRSVP